MGWSESEWWGHGGGTLGRVVSMLRSVEAFDDCVGRKSRLSFLAMVACRGGFAAEC